MYRGWSRLLAVLAGSVLAVACSVDDGGGDDGGGAGSDGTDITTIDPTMRDVQAIALRDVQPNRDAFFAMDPPPMTCAPDGGRGFADAGNVTGTADCPSDRNREGCPCDHPGETAPCWPGLRVNRNRGLCHDGMTTCNSAEFPVWGPCTGAVLPTPGATRGAAACQCFSQGRWQIDNLSPCFITSGSTVYAVSTIQSGTTAQCPTVTTVPPPVPSTPWSTNSLNVDCEGQFELCYTLKAGNVMAPSASDCTLVRVCTRGWYPRRGVMTTFPPLPAWSSADTACAQRFQTGGYGEMSVLGLSSECQDINNGSGGPFVFLRVGYCAGDCSMHPTRADCVACMTGGSGMF
jgi:hypothetical protein